jgi:hypothetical protein
MGEDQFMGPVARRVPWSALSTLLAAAGIGTSIASVVAAATGTPAASAVLLVFVPMA